MNPHVSDPGLALLCLAPTVSSFLDVASLVDVPSDLLPAAAYATEALPARIAERYRHLAFRSRLRATLADRMRSEYLAADVDDAHLGPGFWATTNAAAALVVHDPC